MAKNSPHGTRERYTSAKCRCRACTIANAEYTRNLRLRKRGISPEPSQSPIPASATHVEDAPSLVASPPRGVVPADSSATVTALPSRLAAVAAAGRRVSPPAETLPEVGRVEAAVGEEISQLSARSRHVGLVENALAMARILDDRRLVTTHPSASRQLQATLNKLWSLSVGRGSKLASVASM